RPQAGGARRHADRHQDHAAPAPPAAQELPLRNARTVWHGDPEEVMTRALAAIAGGLAVAGVLVEPQTRPAFMLEGTTVAQIEAALKAKTITCRALVEQYLARIDANDRKGAILNAIVLTNPDALKTADDLDRRAAPGAALGPLHCVPVIVKDNYETIDMPTT